MIAIFGHAGDDVGRGDIGGLGSLGSLGLGGLALDLDHGQLGHRGSFPCLAVPGHVEGDGRFLGSVLAILDGVSLSILRGGDGDGADIAVAVLRHLTDREGVRDQVHRLSAVIAIFGHAGDDVGRGDLGGHGSLGSLGLGGLALDLDLGQLGHRGSFPCLAVPGHVEGDGLRNGSVLAVLDGVSISILRGGDGDGADIVVAFLRHLTDREGVRDQVHLLGGVVVLGGRAGDDVGRGDLGGHGSLGSFGLGGLALDLDLGQLSHLGSFPLLTVPGHVEGDGLRNGGVLAVLDGVSLSILRGGDGDGADIAVAVLRHLTDREGVRDQVHRLSAVIAIFGHAGDDVGRGDIGGLGSLGNNLGGLVSIAVHQPQLRGVVGVGCAKEHALLGRGDAAQAVVCSIAETVAGDDVEVNTVLGNQQVKTGFALLRIVVAAEVVNKVVDSFIVNDGIVDFEDLIKHCLDAFLHRVHEVELILPAHGGNGSHRSILSEELCGCLRILGGELNRVNRAQLVKNAINLGLECLIVGEHLAVIRHRVLVSGHIRCKTGELLNQLERIIGEDGLAQEPLEEYVVAVFAQRSFQSLLQFISTTADIIVLHVAKLTIRDLGELIGYSGGIIGADVELTIVLAHAPDILVGVVAKTSAEVADGAVGEVGVVVLAGHLLKVLVRVHAIEIDGVVEVVVQQFEVASGGNFCKVEHGVVIGAHIQVTIVNPQVAGHGVIDAKTVAILAAGLVTNDLLPSELAIAVLVATVHGKALLVDLAVDVLIRHDGNIQVAVILDDIPDTAAVQTVGVHDGREIIEVVLISDNTPFTQVSAGVAAGNDDAAGSLVAIIVIRSEAHENLAVIDDQTVHAAGNNAVETGVVVGDLSLVRIGVYLDQRSCGLAHADKVELVIKTANHAIAGQTVETGKTGVTHENIGIVLTDVALAEDDLCFERRLVYGDDDGIPAGGISLVEGANAEHAAHDLSRHFLGIGISGQLAIFYHTVKGRLYVEVVLMPCGIGAGANINVIAVLAAVRHGPGVTVATILIFAGENSVDLARTQSRVRNLVDRVATIGVDALLSRFVADVPVVVADNRGERRSREQSDYHDQTEQNAQ